MTYQEIFEKLKILALSTIHTPSNNYILLHLLENNPSYEEILIDVVAHCLIYEDVLQWDRYGVSMTDPELKTYTLSVFLKRFLQDETSFVFLIDQFVEMQIDEKRKSIEFVPLTCPIPMISQEAIRAKAWQIVKYFSCIYTPLEDE